MSHTLDEKSTVVDTTSSPAATDGSELKRLFGTLLTPRFILVFLLGQFLSFCITATSVSTTELAIKYNVNFPTTQTLLNYVLLAIIYTPITIWKYGFTGWLKVLKNRGWKYILLAIVDVEGNYFVVKAYQYTSILSAMLLDAWSIPVVVMLSFFFLKVHYHWSQFFGILMCLAGLGLLVKSDIDAGKDMQTGANYSKGDIFCIIGATFYGFSNVGEEFLVRKYPLWEVVGQMGFWGTIVTVIQLAILERQELQDTQWSGNMVGLLIAFNVAMFFLYTGAPELFRKSSATFFNLSLLTSDFYGLIFGLYLFDQQMDRLYPVAYVGVVIGLIIYYVYPATQPNITRDNELLKEKHEEETANEVV